MSDRPKIWQTAIRLLVCGMLLGWIFHSIFVHEARLLGPSWESLSFGERIKAAWTKGPLQLAKTLAAVQLPALLLSFFFMGLTLLIGIFRWRVVLDVYGLGLGFQRTAGISMVAHFFNSFLLGSTGGDLLKAYYAARETHHKKAEAVTAVFVDRILGLTAMLVFAGVMVLPNLSLIRGARPLGALIWVTALMLVASIVVVIISLWGGISKGFPRARHWLRRLPKGEWLEKALKACRELGRHPLALIKILGLSMALNVACVCQIWALKEGMGLEISLRPLMMIVPMIICVSALPITPSGLGIRENLYVTILGVSAIGIDATDALSLSLLAYVGSLAWSVIGGFVYLSLRERQHLEEVTQGEFEE